MNSSNSSNKKITKTAATAKAAPAKTRSSEEAKVAPPKSRSRTPVDHQQRPGTKTGKRAPSSKAVESEALPSKSPAGRKTTKNNTTTTTAARGRQAVTQMSELE